MSVRLLLVLFCAATAAADTPPAYLSVVASTTDFQEISLPDSIHSDVLRVTKYMAPASKDPALLPTVYQNSNLEPMHYVFLLENFPERFAGMTTAEYLAMILYRETRQYFSGAVYAFEDPEGNVFYGFDVNTNSSVPSERLNAEETRAIYDHLSETFFPRPFVYSPRSTSDIVEAESWVDPGFSIYLPGSPAPEGYQPYTLGTNYGRVRILSVQELGDLVEGDLSWQDILVLDRSPFDIEGVVAAVITGEPQTELSHVAVRSARRGTPNAYLEKAHEVFAPVEDQLVRLTVSEDGYEVETGVSPADAQAWWDEHRPSIGEVISPDLVYKNLDRLQAMDVGEATAPLASKFGGKAANLAKMSDYLPAEYQVPGFAIPFHYYQEFMDSNTIWDCRTGRPVLRTYNEYLESLFEDPLFQSDGVHRADLLDELCDEARDNGQIDSALITTLVRRIEEVFGDTDQMVRFRSSSNAEDSVRFNGAGLYRSSSVCAEDSTDEDEEGPSQCDPNQSNERTVERGLIRVWMSLWDYRAYEERSYYQIPQENSAMAVLVTPAFPNEAANGVGFTGDPIAGKKAGYVINVQIGDNSVVQPDPGVLPEKEVLEIEDGQVIAIHRMRPSSLMPPGEWVLSATQLHTLGAVMAIAEANHPVDQAGYLADDVLLDIEFKFTQEGQLIFKQVRPFLRSGATLHVPGDTTGDGSVDHGDVFVFSFHWKCGASLANNRSNVNGDDRIDARDLLSLFQSWVSQGEPDSSSRLP